MKIIDGGVTAAKGFKAAAAAAEIKYKGRTDMAMCSGSGVLPRRFNSRIEANLSSRIFSSCRSCITI